MAVLLAAFAAGTHGGEIVPHHQSWLAVTRECPRRIMGELHRCGEYHHGTTPRFPGKVLCCHRDTPLPEGWQPTEAQQQAGAASLALFDPGTAVAAE